MNESIFGGANSITVRLEYKNTKGMLANGKKGRLTMGMLGEKRLKFRATNVKFDESP